MLFRQASQARKVIVKASSAALTSCYLKAEAGSAAANGKDDTSSSLK
jgi:hypothetical protein